MRRIASKVSIIGCGTWPTTLAKVLAENGHRVSMWCHRQAIVDEINIAHSHNKVLPGISLPETVYATGDLKEALQNSESVIIGLASSYYTHIEAVASLVQGQPILSLTKGLLPEPHMLISRYLSEMFKHSPIAVLSGPNLAKEIAQRKPSATVIASQDESVAKGFQTLMSNSYFRAYTSVDPVGVELGGVLKNIMAIAVGINDGLALGSNAKAALITRGLQEMVRFAKTFDAKTETLYGLSGLGDLIATCDSSQSRNYTVGLGLASGQSLDGIISALGQHAEGVNTTKVVVLHARAKGVQMPVSEAVYDVLFKTITPQQAIQKLMNRELKPE